MKVGGGFPGVLRAPRNVAGNQNPSGRCAALAGLRLAHHAARLGAALAFCDRCPCSVSLHPPQAALDSAAPKGEPLTGSRGKASPPRGGVCEADGGVWHVPATQNPAGREKQTAGSRPRPTKQGERRYKKPTSALAETPAGRMHAAPTSCRKVYHKYRAFAAVRRAGS